MDGTGLSGVASGVGVFGQSTGPNGFSGVRGESTGGPGVSGASVGSVGVDAKTATGPAAVRAISSGNGHGVLGSAPHIGVFGTSTGNEGFSGVHGECVGGPGVSGTSFGSVGVDARTDHGPAALRAVHARNGLAGEFGGNVHVSGDLLVDGDVKLKGGDLAEEFEVVARSMWSPANCNPVTCQCAFLQRSRRASACARTSFNPVIHRRVPRPIELRQQVELRRPRLDPLLQIGDQKVGRLRLGFFVPERHIAGLTHDLELDVPRAAVRIRYRNCVHTPVGDANEASGQRLAGDEVSLVQRLGVGRRESLDLLRVRLAIRAGRAPRGTQASGQATWRSARMFERPS
jgi:hypothetical protein